MRYVGDASWILIACCTSCQLQSHFLAGLGFFLVFAGKIPFKSPVCLFGCFWMGFAGEIHFKSAFHAGFGRFLWGFHSFHSLKGPKDPKGSPRGPGAAALRGGALRQLQRLLRLALGWPSGVLGRFSGGWENVRGGHGCGESGGCLGADLGG